jgi:hypothetical protein
MKALTYIRMEKKTVARPRKTPMNAATHTVSASEPRHLMDWTQLTILGTFVRQSHLVHASLGGLFGISTLRPPRKNHREARGKEEKIPHTRHDAGCPGGWSDSLPPHYSPPCCMVVAGLTEVRSKTRPEQNGGLE